MYEKKITNLDTFLCKIFPQGEFTFKKETKQNTTYLSLELTREKIIGLIERITPEIKINVENIMNQDYYIDKFLDHLANSMHATKEGLYLQFKCSTKGLPTAAILKNQIQTNLNRCQKDLAKQHATEAKSRTAAKALTVQTVQTVQTVTVTTDAAHPLPAAQQHPEEEEDAAAVAAAIQTQLPEQQTTTPISFFSNASTKNEIAPPPQHWENDYSLFGGKRFNFNLRMDEFTPNSSYG